VLERPAAREDRRQPPNRFGVAELGRLAQRLLRLGARDQVGAVEGAIEGIEVIE
jgi:hypothetical protein